MNAPALADLLAHLDSGKPVLAGTPLYDVMVYYSNEAMRITSLINSSWHSADGLQKLMALLTGRQIDSEFMMFPPFYSDFGKNIHLGKKVFINSGCCFQDQGGIYIGNNVLIGHKVVLATINHGLCPSDRSTNYPAPVRIGNNVWIGANATILPGVSIGDDAVVAAGAVVSRDVGPGLVAGGVPAKILKKVPQKD